MVEYGALEFAPSCFQLIEVSFDLPTPSEARGSQYLVQCTVTEERINTYTVKHVAISRHVRLLRLFCPPVCTCRRVMLRWQGGYVCATEFNLCIGTGHPFVTRNLSRNSQLSPSGINRNVFVKSACQMLDNRYFSTTKECYPRERDHLIE